jgi:MFS transporter, DHA2 family, multidrug resistance protein
MSAQQDRDNRWPITICVMLATFMNSLDMTIANVALPHMQGSVSASQEQITWVLTSYIVASAIAMPLAGWLADRVGRKRLFIICITGFTIASMMCGLSSNLVEIIAARLLQGLFGAALTPLSQAVMLDVHPPEDHGQAMSIWGAGAILGPIIGPALGGFLTEQMSWRWVFFINLPIGILALAGVLVFMSGDRTTKAKPFDFLGFGSLVVAIGAFQLGLDRGPSLDWFEAPEIWIEFGLAAAGLWVFIFHTVSAKHPFFDQSLAKDRNFVTATVFGFFIGIMLFSAMALLTPMMQTLMGYPVLTAGLVSMPRGVGLFIAMMVVGRLIGRIDTRLILLIGLVFCAVSQFQMTHFDLMMPAMPFMVSGFIQGIGMGLIFIPMTTVAFTTVGPALRAEASAVFTLVRNLGSSVGISLMQGLFIANMQVMHGSLTERIDPANPIVAGAAGASFDLSTTAGLMGLNAEITRQATMVSYLDVFRLLLIISFCCMPMLLLMRPPKTATGEPVHVALD